MKSTKSKKKTTKTEPPPHPFHGPFKSFTINAALEENDDGDFDLVITPGGVFTSGTHKPRGGTAVNLTNHFLSTRAIRLRAPDGREWRGVVMPRLGGGRQKVVIGFFSIPETLRAENPEFTTQENGVWVSTQP